LQWSTLQAFVIVVCVAGNCFVDWISFGLTRMLFEVSGQIKNVGRSIVLIFMDLLLTVNAFALIYSIPLALVIFASSGLSGKFPVWADGSAWADIHDTQNGNDISQVFFWAKACMSTLGAFEARIFFKQYIYV
jgi:hypothetical protein